MNPNPKCHTLLLAVSMGMTIHLFVHLFQPQFEHTQGTMSDSFTASLQNAAKCFAFNQPSNVAKAKPLERENNRMSPKPLQPRSKLHI